ncbi:MAG: UPF0182 family protein [Microcoleaceae cyanobacterium]
MNRGTGYSWQNIKRLDQRSPGKLQARWQRNIVTGAIALLVLGFIIWSLVCLRAEAIWFTEVDFLPVFTRILITKFSLFIIVGILTSGFWLANLAIAERYRYNSTNLLVKDKLVERQAMLVIPLNKLQPIQDSNSPSSPINNILPALRLRSLLALTITLSSLISLIFVYIGEIVLNYWQSDFYDSTPQALAQIPNVFDLSVIFSLLPRLLQQPQLLIISVGVTAAIMMRPLAVLRAIAIILSLSLSFILVHHWDKILQFIYATPFDNIEEVFNLDIGFYVFQLPVLQLASLTIFTMILYAEVAVALVYLLSGNSLSQGGFWHFSPIQQKHLHGLGSLLMFSVAGGYILSSLELVYSPRGVTYGAGFTDVRVQLPVNILLALLAFAIALSLACQVLVKFNRSVIHTDRQSSQSKLLVKHQVRWQQQLFTGNYSLRKIFASYLAIAIILGWLLPEFVQYLVVEPNELVREVNYIERNIAFTRKAFDIDKIDTKYFDPSNQLTYQDILNNKQTVDNIRLWDTRPILQANRQLQQIRPYYEFTGADIDRYTVFTDNDDPKNTAVTKTKQQVIIAPRELNYQAVPDKAKTWLNEHFVYTHGYGFTLSPVNKIGEGGLPDYLVKNIGPDPRIAPDSTLEVSPLIEGLLPIGTPRIYYGELTNNNILVTGQAGNQKEFDYPNSETNVYNTYDGSGGIVLDNFFKKWLFAIYTGNWQLGISRNVDTETRLLWRRNINQRVRAIAPFLRYDKDPYLVVADHPWIESVEDSETELIGNQTRIVPKKPNYLYWIIDAYTTSNHYPYSEPATNEFNYIRNSVKVVIDATNGKVKFYYVEQELDPVIRTWIKVFPQLFTPLQAMPFSLKQHIRYPTDLFSIQSERLLAYHIDDAQTFYNREDLWRVPSEIYGSNQQPVMPYYLTTKLPGEKAEEFILLLPFTPASRNNLVGWLAARSDGKNYGRLLLYEFPKQKLIYGPEQIEALINQEPDISQQISLWTRQGSKAIQGNLLVIPINQSLLYVEPIYLEASENSLPTLVRVIVVYENRIAMKDNLQDALQAVFQAKSIDAPIINGL